MMKIEIQTKNAAFEDDNESTECLRILVEVTTRIIRGEFPTLGEPWPLYDVNGNRVGQVTR